MFRQNPANVQTRRRHEYQRGTQECVRHNGFNTLLSVTKTK
jgi:hypothetical protein